jgi:hypothetical protein
MERKAQTQVITIVLLSGILISLVGTAYLWGIPLISKRTSVTDFLSAEDFIVKLDQKITEIANSGSGEASVGFSKGSIKVVPYNDLSSDNNSITYEFPITQPLVMGKSVILKTSVLGENATYGEAEPRIINMTSESAPPDYKLNFNLHYRELDTRDQPYKGYKIALERGSITGSNQVVVSYDRTEILSGQRADKQGDLIVTYIKISVV